MEYKYLGSTMENVISTFNIVSFIASIASLILAIVAIWLSLKFFEKSSEASEKTNEAARGISESVQRLEKLFDKLYSDTFSVMKDTVTDMRKHLWSDDQNEEEITKIEKQAEKKAESRISEIKKEISSELSQIFERQKIQREGTDKKIESIKAELSDLIEKAISESRDVELKAREETFKEFILKKLKQASKSNSTIIVEDILELANKDNISTKRILGELIRMEEEGLINLFNKMRLGNKREVKEIIVPSTRIELKK